jgi:hypothetical protein
VDGADVRVVGFFLCMFFELDALALEAKWSSWATCLATIASKPSRPKPSPMLVAERFAMRVGRRGEGKYLNEMG